MSNEFEGWCILELTGHRKLAGYVKGKEIAGHSFIGINVPGHGEEIIATQFYNPTAVYCITPVTERMARLTAESYHPNPIHRWELAGLTQEEAIDEEHPF